MDLNLLKSRYHVSRPSPRRFMVNFVKLRDVVLEVNKPKVLGFWIVETI